MKGHPNTTLLSIWGMVALATVGLAARGESLAAFDGRCILADCVAPRSNIPDILGRRALSARRLARLGATPDFRHGLLGAGSTAVDVKGTARVGTRPQATAVVWLDAPNAPPLAQQTKIVLHQRNLTFLPHVLAVRTGTIVDFPNEDRVFHNVFSFKDGKPFDLGIYPVGSMKQVTFSESGVTRLFCNIHPNMGGYVVSVDSPYFSAVDENGTFTLAAVPPGSYTYHAWKPGSPILTGAAVIQSGSPLEIIWR